MAPSLEHFQPKWMPVRRRKCDPHETHDAFSAEVDAGSASKMRARMKPERYKQTGERSPAPPIQATFWDQNVMLVPMPISSEL